MTVYLVGAGPGDPGLLTVRGAELLRGADVVVYDRLSAAGLLDLAPAEAERINVGKAPGRATGAGARSHSGRQVPTWTHCRRHCNVASTVDREHRGHGWGVESTHISAMETSSAIAGSRYLEDDGSALRNGYALVLNGLLDQRSLASMNPAWTALLIASTRDAAPSFP